MLFMLSSPVLLLSTAASLHILTWKHQIDHFSLMIYYYLLVAVMSTTALLTRPSVGVTPFSIIHLRS